MWKAIVNGIEVPKCEVDRLNKGEITLLVSVDFPKLNELKALSSDENAAFAVNVNTEFVTLSFEACWLISFSNNGQIGSYNPETGTPGAARFIFGFKIA